MSTRSKRVWAVDVEEIRRQARQRVGALEIVVLCAHLSAADASEIEARLRVEADLNATKEGSMRLECDSDMVRVVLGQAQLEAPAAARDRKAEFIRLGLDALERAALVAEKDVDGVTPTAPAVASEPPRDGSKLFYEIPTDPTPNPTPAPLEREDALPDWAIEGALTYENFGGDITGLLGGEFRVVPAIADHWAVRSGLGVAAGLGIPENFRTTQWNVGLGVEFQPFDWLGFGVSALLSSLVFTRDPGQSIAGATSQLLGGELELDWSPFGYGSGPRLGLRARLYTAERAIFLGATESFRLSAGTFGLTLGQRFGFD